jgi:hypothetical protein
MILRRGPHSIFPLRFLKLVASIAASSIQGY